MPVHPPYPQPLLLPQAELAVELHVGQRLPQDERTRAAAACKDKAAGAVSPFAGDLDRLMAAWFATDGNEEMSSPARWAAIGRDNTEQGIALDELAGLLAREGRFPEAAAAEQRAVELMPESAMLWRMMVGLAHGDPKTVNAAYGRCPADPEIWLAHIVSGIRDGKSEAWASAELEEAVARDAYSPGTLVRAGDFLRRQNMTGAAARAAKAAIADCRGLLPAYVLGMRCALATGDTNWAVACAKDAANNALEQTPFNKIVAALKMGRNATDMDTVDTLEKLVAQSPNRPVWATTLGRLYLDRGNPRQALSLFEPFIDQESINLQMRSILAAAESARRSGDSEEAIRILEKAYAKDPSNRFVLNNLVHTLALDLNGLPRARQLLPKLAAAYGDSFVLFDTTALVYSQAGDVSSIVTTLWLPWTSSA